MGNTNGSDLNTTSTIYMIDFFLWLKWHSSLDLETDLINTYLSYIEVEDSCKVTLMWATKYSFIIIIIIIQNLLMYKGSNFKTINTKKKYEERGDIIWKTSQDSPQAYVQKIKGIGFQNC